MRKFYETQNDVLDNIIFNLLVLDGNETNLIGDIYDFEYRDYVEFVKEMMKKKYDVRYCGLDECVCHPESKLRNYFENTELIRFLREQMWNYYNEMVELIYGNYDCSNTVFKLSYSRSDYLK